MRTLVKSKFSIGLSVMQEKLRLSRALGLKANKIAIVDDDVNVKDQLVAAPGLFY